MAENLGAGFGLEAPEPVDNASIKEDNQKTPGAKVRRSRRRRPTRGRRPNGRRKPTSASYLLVVSVRPGRTQVAILEKDNVVEHYVTTDAARSLVGNIYLGEVKNVLPGMEAAFVDIGAGRNGVLYAGELSYAEETEEQAPPRIETVLSPGQSILVQVTKDPMGTKGPRLTAQISLAGRYLVMVPDGVSAGVSRRVSDEERERLRKLASELDRQGHGLIVRTAAAGTQLDDLRRDLSRLLTTWELVRRTADSARAPALVYQEPELDVRIFRDLLTSDMQRVVVDDATTYEKLRSYVQEVSPELADRIELHVQPLPLLEEFHVVEQVRKALHRKVWLRSGGYLIFDRTEALTVVDVNTGRYVGKEGLEETVVRTNLEAAREIARQLRLRDIGGIIVIDFIDMMRPENREQLLTSFKDELAKDKTRTQLLSGVSPLGLLEMTRKKVSEGLLEAFSHRCPQCDGRGVIIEEEEG